MDRLLLGSLIRFNQKDLVMFAYFHCLPFIQWVIKVLHKSRQQNWRHLQESLVFRVHRRYIQHQEEQGRRCIASRLTGPCYSRWSWRHDTSGLQKHGLHHLSFYLTPLFIKEHIHFRTVSLRLIKQNACWKGMADVFILNGNSWPGAYNCYVFFLIL